MSQDYLKTNATASTIKTNDFFSPIKIESTAEIKKLPTQRKNYIFIKSGNEFEKVAFDEVLYIKAGGSYATIQTKEKIYTASTNMKSVLSQFKWPSLKRCHRSYAVNIDTIESYNDNAVNLGKGENAFSIPISDSYRSEIINMLPKLTTE